MTDLVYLYGFVPADASGPDTLGGMADRSITLLDLGPVRAAVSRVPADIYEAERIEARLQDISWVAEQGAAHETVVAWFVDHSEILPVSLFTLYSSEAALRDTVAARTSELAARLARLKGKREWDIKISMNEAEVEGHAATLSPRIAELERAAADAAPGKRYLLERKRSDLLKDEVRAAAHAVASSAFDTVRAVATEHRVLPLPRSTADLPVILHGALLVERDRQAELVRLLEATQAQLASTGLTLSFSGPWAAYRFTGEHEPATDAG